MKTARERILETIRAQQVVTTAELAQFLQTTEANARRHLAILIRQGLVAVIGELPISGPGRPARLYGPAPVTLGSNLDLLAEALLDEILGGHTPEAQAKILQRLATKIEAAISAQMIPNPVPGRRSEHLSTRLSAAVRILNTAHYQARWEARPEAPRLILSHCPFGTLVERRPEICRIDAYLFEALVGAPMEELMRLAPDRRGVPHCHFRVGTASAKPGS